MKIPSPVSCSLGDKNGVTGLVEAHGGGFLVVLKTAENFKDWAGIGPFFGNGE